MSATLVDSSVLLDVATEDPRWFAWSSAALERAADRGVLVVNPIIWAEVSVGFVRIEELDAALPSALFRRDPLPYEAGFLAPSPSMLLLPHLRSQTARRGSDAWSGSEAK